MLRAIIVDDEPKSRRALQRIIKEFCPQLEVLDSAEDVLSGVKLIQKVKPDIVFLDIEMPNYSGFKLIEYFDQINFQIIFTTAYEHYAIQAFHASATGYLLKPIEINELINVVKKAEKIHLQRKQSLENTATTFSKIDPNKKIDLPTKNGIIYLTINEILFLKAEGRNSYIFFKDGRNVLTTLNMKECEKIFFKTTLLRIHKSHIINLAFIKKYVKKLDAYVEMEGGFKLDVGQAFKDQLNKGLSFFAK